MALIQVLREEGFTYHLGDTDMTAKAPRGLFTKLGFQELPVHNIFIHRGLTGCFDFEGLDERADKKAI